MAGQSANPRSLVPEARGEFPRSRQSRAPNCTQLPGPKAPHRCQTHTGPGQAGCAGRIDRNAPQRLKRVFRIMFRQGSLRPRGRRRIGSSMNSHASNADPRPPRHWHRCAGCCSAVRLTSAHAGSPAPAIVQGPARRRHHRALTWSGCRAVTRHKASGPEFSRWSKDRLLPPWRRQDRTDMILTKKPQTPLDGRSRHRYTAPRVPA